MSRIVTALTLVVLAGCAKPTRIVLEPKQPSIRSRADAITMIAHVMTSHMENAEAKLTWSVEDPSIVTVSDHGVLKGVGSGRTKVIAKHGDLTASMPVEVLFVESLKAEAQKVELSQEKGDPMDPKVVAVSYDGLPLKDRVLDYAVKDPTVCRVDKMGAFWPINPGETVVTASADGHSLDIPCVVTKK